MFNLLKQTYGTKRTLFGKLAEKLGIPSPFCPEMELFTRNEATPNFCLPSAPHCPEALIIFVLLVAWGEVEVGARCPGVPV